MNRRLLFQSSCVLLLTAAVGFAQQTQSTGEPTAETVYKNIQIFKGQPASVVRPAMDGITAALGVKCSFCHVRDNKGQWQFDKDDKEEKKTAREMYQMMTKINQDNFDGHMEVTCATCHQGHSSPNRVPPIGQPAAPDRVPGGANDASMPKADDLVANYVKAIGGEDSVAKVQTVVMKGNVKSDDFNATFETDAKAPSQVYHTFSFEEGVFNQGYDGTTGWQSFGGNTEKLAGTELSDLKASSPFLYIDPKTAYSGFRRVRKDTIDGKDMYVVDVQTGEGQNRVRLYFDPATNLLARVWTGEQTVVGLVPSTEDYSNYRDVDGVKIPFTLVDTTGDGVRTITLTDVKVNADVPDSKFTMPSK